MDYFLHFYKKNHMHKNCYEQNINVRRNNETIHISHDFSNPMVKSFMMIEEI